MKFLINIILILFFFNVAVAENHLQYFIDAALKNNLKLNAERKNQKSIKQNINISRSEFLLLIQTPLKYMIKARCF